MLYITNIGEMPDDLFAQLSTAFLGFSSTMPYDSSNVEAVRPWLELSLPNAGTDGETIVFGDARFTIYNTGLIQINYTSVSSIRKRIFC